MKTVLILSGGLDSTTLLYELIASGEEVIALSFDYGQKHRVELEFAKATTARLGVPHEIVPLAGIFSGSALTNDLPMPKTDYSVGSMKSTVVPNRNMVMLSIAISKGIQNQCDAVVYGAHAGDHDVYPDCRHEFVEAMQSAALLCDWHRIRLLAPFLNFTKRQIVDRARELGVPIDQTWSCYQGGETPCGECGSCRARQDALA